MQLLFKPINVEGYGMIYLFVVECTLQCQWCGKKGSAKYLEVLPSVQAFLKLCVLGRKDGQI